MKRIYSKQRLSKTQLNSAYTKTLHWFFAFPYREFSLTNIVEELQISKTTANIIITTLIKENFIKRNIIGRVWRLQSNPLHPFNITRKVPHHLQLIYESGLLEILYEEFPNAKAISLFGSYRKGDDTEQSDIDIAIEIDNNEAVQIAEFPPIPQLGYRKNISVNVHVFCRNKIEVNLFANIVNGIVLSGFLEARP